MQCKKCFTELPDQANFCWQCGVAQKQAVQKQPEKQVKWETCEIISAEVKTGRVNHEWEFRAEASGPNGKYLACAPYVTKINPHANFDYLSKESSNYVRHVFVSLVRALIQEGWESLDIMGAYWYSYRFRRKLKE